MRLSAPVKMLLKKHDLIEGVLLEEDGEEIQVDAKAVVIATGGYANSKEWIKKYAGLDLGLNVVAVGNVCKTGDGIRMAWEAGADKVGLGVLELFRVGPMGPEDLTKSTVEYAAVQPDLWVDTEGERFCDETVGFYETSVGNASVRSKQWCNYSIFDSSTVVRLMETGIDKAHGTGLLPGARLTELDRDLAATIVNGSTEVFEAGSVPELAEKIGVSPAVLQKTVDEYNAFCDKRHDDLFAKDPKYLRPLTGPRYYAIRARTICLGTLGGIRINERCEVVDASGRVIPGLYAAGYDAGGMYGDSYPIRPASGLSSGFALNSGRIAGRNAARMETRAT